MKYSPALDFCALLALLQAVKCAPAPEPTKTQPSNRPLVTTKIDSNKVSLLEPYVRFDRPAHPADRIGTTSNHVQKINYNVVDEQSFVVPEDLTISQAIQPKRQEPLKNEQEMVPYIHQATEWPLPDLREESIEAAKNKLEEDFKQLDVTEIDKAINNLKEEFSPKIERQDTEEVLETYNHFIRDYKHLARGFSEGGVLMKLIREKNGDIEVAKNFFDTMRRQLESFREYYARDWYKKFNTLFNKINSADLKKLGDFLSNLDFATHYGEIEKDYYKLLEIWQVMLVADTFMSSGKYHLALNKPLNEYNGIISDVLHKSRDKLIELTERLDKELPDRSRKDISKVMATHEEALNKEHEKTKDVPVNLSEAIKDIIQASAISPAGFHQRVVDNTKAVKDKNPWLKEHIFADLSEERVWPIEQYADFINHLRNKGDDWKEIIDATYESLQVPIPKVQPNEGANS